MSEQLEVSTVVTRPVPPLRRGKQKPPSPESLKASSYRPQHLPLTKNLIRTTTGPAVSTFPYEGKPFYLKELLETSGENKGFKLIQSDEYLGPSPGLSSSFIPGPWGAGHSFSGTNFPSGFPYSSTNTNSSEKGGRKNNQKGILRNLSMSKFCSMPRPPVSEVTSASVSHVDQTEREDIRRPMLPPPTPPLPPPLLRMQSGSTSTLVMKNMESLFPEYKVKGKMSHHSDDNMLIASSDSFWEPGNYKRTTKRIEDGYKLCNDLISLVQERADLEKGYARSLKTWSKRWAETIEKGPEYGTTEAACKGVLVEADRICDVHSTIKDDLQNDVIGQIRSWQKDNYHKNVMNLKERKEMEDLFKKAQKPWAKILAKVNKLKNDYHNACKNEKSALNQERNALSDTAMSPDQVKRTQEKVTKSKEEVQKAKEKYEASLQEITAYNPKYIEDMREVFDKCQEMEAKRLKFFKEAMYSIHKCINISEKPELPQIYEEFHHTVSNADHLKDLKWWSNNHGVNMAMNWPTFEDYLEEFRDITKSRIKESVPTGGITLLTQKSVSDDLPGGGPAEITKGSSIKIRANGNEVNKPISKKEPKGTDETKTNGSGKERNPFEEEEWDECSNSEGAFVDRGEPGIPVRALYDYDGAEDDELTFRQGDVFDKLEDEDEQGWCKGRKSGRVGLYPANYVEVVP